MYLLPELLIFGGLEGCVTTLTPSFQRCSTLRRWMALCQCPCPVLLQGGDCDDDDDDCDDDCDDDFDGDDDSGWPCASARAQSCSKVVMIDSL